MSWTNLCVEAFCGGDVDDKENYPCGKNCSSHLCLENSMCPHFAYAKTTEREVASFPPLNLIIKDRLGIWKEDLYWKLRWWFWDSLWFNRQKVQRFFDSIETVSGEDCPELAEYEKEEKQNQVNFVIWFEKAKKDYCED